MSCCWFKPEYVWPWTPLSPQVWLLLWDFPISVSGPSVFPGRETRAHQIPLILFLPPQTHHLSCWSLVCVVPQCMSPAIPPIQAFIITPPGPQLPPPCFLPSSHHPAWYLINYLWNTAISTPHDHYVTIIPSCCLWKNVKTKQKTWNWHEIHR